MTRINRRLTRLFAAVPAAAALVVLGGGTANAAVVDPSGAGITLATTINFYPDGAGTVLDITATGTFTSSLFENTTIALQVAGTETWSDANGTHTAPIEGNPTSVAFANTNSVEFDVYLPPGATADVNYTAEDAGLAPSPFTGSCFGTGVHLSSGTNLTTNDC